MYSNYRATTAILRTKRSLSDAFREEAARMIEALAQLTAESEMVEKAHKQQNQPFYSKGLEMARDIAPAKPDPEDGG